MKLFEKQHEINKILEDVKEVAGFLWQRGWVEKNAGNISVRLPDSIDKKILSGCKEIKTDFVAPGLSGQSFYVTGTGKRMRDIAKEPLENGVIIQVNHEGSALYLVNSSEDSVEPSSELPTHLGIHQMIAERGTGEIVVMHTHATEVIALTQWREIKDSESLNHILWGMHTESIVFVPKGVGFVPYILPGTQTIAEATIESFRKHDLVVWEKHGIFAIGKSVNDTFDAIDIVAKSAKIWFQCKSAGFTPEGLNEDQLGELRKLVKKFNTL